MKIPEKKEAKNHKLKNKSVTKKPKKEHVLIVAQEIKFARLLAGNEKKIRDRALKTLKKWLSGCFQKGYVFKEDDFSRIWKGLFYAVWMSDKPLLQEELCDNIASILDMFPPDQYKYALLMTKVGFKTLATEWYGIDQHRMDKFLMLVRRYLRGSLRCVERCNWTEAACKSYARMLTASDGLFALKTPLYARNATSMLLHFIDCYLEEIAKVSKGEIPPSSLASLLRPICAYMCGGESATLCTAARRLLTALLRQSEENLIYRQRTSAWEKMGCPEGGPEALVSDDDDDDEKQNSDESDGEENSSEKPLDPRAGRVDVELPLLRVPCDEITRMLRDLLKHATSKAHRRAKICLERFEKLARKEYPLPIQDSLVGSEQVSMAKPSVAAKSLFALEKTLISSSDELALRGLSRKHRKRLLAKSRAGLSIVEDAEKLQCTQNNAAGNWQVEDTEPQSKNNKDTDRNKENKENVTKSRKRKQEKQNGDVATKKQKIHVKTEKKTEEKNKTSKKKQRITKMKTATNNCKPEKNAKTISEKKKEKISLTNVTPKLNNKNVVSSTEKSKLVKQKTESPKKIEKTQKDSKNSPTIVSKKVKNFQKQISPKIDKRNLATPKKVKFVLKNNSMQGPVDYYKSVRQSPNIPFDSTKQPFKTNLKVSTPSPINPFFKKKLRMRF